MPLAVKPSRLPETTLEHIMQAKWLAEQQTQIETTSCSPQPYRLAKSTPFRVHLAYTCTCYLFQSDRTPKKQNCHLRHVAVLTTIDQLFANGVRKVWQCKVQEAHSAAIVDGIATHA